MLRTRHRYSMVFLHCVAFSPRWLKFLSRHVFAGWKSWPTPGDFETRQLQWYIIKKLLKHVKTQHVNKEDHKNLWWSKTKKRVLTCFLPAMVHDHRKPKGWDIKAFGSDGAWTSGNEGGIASSCPRGHSCSQGRWRFSGRCRWNLIFFSWNCRCLTVKGNQKRAIVKLSINTYKYRYIQSIVIVCMLYL